MKRLMLLAGMLLAILSARLDAATTPTPAQAPEFAGIDRWFNSPPLNLAGLRGKVVLIDFWAYSCINCLHAIPHVQHLYATYKDKGLVVIGVHSPEFDFEKDPGNVRDAIQRLGITYPVAIDNRHATWDAWHNEYWPAEYLIDQDGRLIGHHYGEGDYLRMENAIRLLLGLDLLRGAPSADARPAPAEHSPEMYLGSHRQTHLASPEPGDDGTRRFHAPATLPLDRYALQGVWAVSGEYVRLAAADGALRLHFRASQLHMVASAPSPVPLDVQVDGASQPPVTVQASRLYTLYQGGDDREHELLMRIAEPGLRIYSFTFD